MSFPLKHRLKRGLIFRYDSRHDDGNTPSSPERTNRLEASRPQGSADMEVQGPSSIQRNVPVGPSKPVKPPANSPASAPATPPPKDAVEISSAGQMLDKLSKSPAVRAERLAQIKADIASGKYDTDEKLEAAMMSLLQSIVGNESHD